MSSGKHSAHGGHRGRIATVALAICVVGGSSLVGAAIVSQRPVPPMPAASARVSGAPLPAGVEAGDSWLREGGEARAPAVTVPTATGPVMRPSSPVRLAIPSIDVDSVVQHLGQDAGGGLEVPAQGPHYDEAGWYRYSPTPGARGPAILLGHVDSAAGGPSVFFRLGELEAGDRISVTRADRSTAVFVVDAVQRYAKDDFPTELVYGDIDHAGLRILTCGGAFDRTTRHYTDNIVVFASLVDRNDA